MRSISVDMYGLVPPMTGSLSLLKSTLCSRPMMAVNSRLIAARRALVCVV